MQPRMPRSFSWLVPMILAATMGGCDKGPAKKEVGSQTAAQSTAGEASTVTGADPAATAAKTVRLTAIPDGYELGDTVFAADGLRVGFVAKRDGKAVVYLDGVPGRPYDDAWRPVFQPRGNGFAFIAKQGSSEFVVVDGVEGVHYDAVGSMRLSPEGTVVYAASRDGAWRVVSGSRESPGAGPAEPPLFLSSDGKRLVYIEQRAGKGTFRLRACSLALAACRSGPDHEGISLAMADRAGALLAYIVTADSGQAVATVALDQPVLTEKIGRWYHYVSVFGLSRGGTHLAFIAGKDGREVLVRGAAEEAFPGFDDPLALAVSVSGRTLCVGLSNDKVGAFVDAQKVVGDYEEIDYPIFTPNGSRWAFVRSRGSQYTLVVEGKEGPPFEMIVDPRFAPDGERVVYRARNGGKRFVVVADGNAKTMREHARYEAVFEVVFRPDGSFAYGANSGKDLLWVTAAN